MNAVEMTAHCIWHQTPPSERAACPACHLPMRRVVEGYYCACCVLTAAPEPCPICTGADWQQPRPEPAPYAYEEAPCAS